jgi:hypothetical protein
MIAIVEIPAVEISEGRVVAVFERELEDLYRYNRTALKCDDEDENSGSSHEERSHPNTEHDD